MANLVDKYPYKIVTNCIDCYESKIKHDPDPYDSFCYDDVKVICTLSGGRAITVGCRPYMTRKECERPAWCPLEARG